MSKPTDRGDIHLVTPPHEDAGTHAKPPSASRACCMMPSRAEFIEASTAVMGWSEEVAGGVFDAMGSLTFDDFDRLAQRLGLQDGKGGACND